MKGSSLLHRLAGALKTPASRPVPRSKHPSPDFPGLPEHVLLSRTHLETGARRGCQTAYLGGGVTLCRVLGRYLMYADAADVSFTPHVLFDGFWEAWITLAVARALRPGWVCVDVGANHGYYSLLCAGAVGPTGTVLACEPNPTLASLLEKTLIVNGFAPTARVLRAAITDIAGEQGVLHIPAQHCLNSRLCSAGVDGAAVQTETLDSVCAELPPVNFVKIDVEGGEERIWYGMGDTLRRSPEIIVLLEYNAGRCADAEGFLAAIQAEGFPLRFVDDDSDIKPVTAEQVLSRQPVKDWMLWLQRGPLTTADSAALHHQDGV